MTRFPFLLALLLASALPGRLAAAGLPSDEALIAGFEKVVFGSEIPGLFGGGKYLKKFAKPVRFHVENLAAKNRKPAVRAFLASLRGKIAGLEIGAEAPESRQADFVVYVVDRKDYGRVGCRVYGNPFMDVPGFCIVRSAFSRAGIRHSDAIIVSDEGETLFRRCLIEEVLQGLGPLGDDPDAPASVFNDASSIARFTRADRIILNMLYDKRLAPGMSAGQARPLLPGILGDIRRRVH